MFFGYNGRDGVITEDTGLIYMRARYYSPEMRRFINADIIHGQISDSTSLNRYAYVNGNPVSNIDPFGLASWWKFVVGAVIIVGLVVATVATGGAAAAAAGSVAATISSSALTGAIIGGAVGATVGYLENGVEGAANGFLAGTVSGTVSGALGGSNLNAKTVATGNAIINVGEELLKDVVEDGVINEVDAVDVIYYAASGYLLNMDNGLMYQGEELQQAQNYCQKKLARETRRANSEFAEKAAKRATSYSESVYGEVMGKYAIDTIKGQGEKLVADTIYENCVRSK